MKAVVINLPSSPERWQQTRQALARVGLDAIRLHALEGETLTSGQLTAIYDERLNRQQFHRPLRPGEIGCYASHLAAWQGLIESGEPALAVFEDDIQVDDDLPLVLQALAATTRQWDMVKIVGRRHEQIERLAPLCAGRSLVSYRRVPSLSCAYVISAAGAAKLLAGRRPFGRPVDVDIRHWWECDLQVYGVHPYPSRPALCSIDSSIADRHGRAAPSQRVRKLWLQGLYTVNNRRALQRGTGLPPLPALSTPAAPPAPRPAGDGRPAPRAEAAPDRPAHGRRNLVVLRAGDASLHRSWLDGGARDFDLFISYYGDTPGRWQADGEYYERRPGPKWPGIAALLGDHPQLLDRYDAFWFPDDDLAASSAVLDRMFAFFHAYRLSLAQPALTTDSYYTWATLLQDPACHIRYTRFVEVMAPLFSHASLRVCAATFSQSPSGWGLDWIWPTLCDQGRLGRIAVLDATPVKHTRPVGGGELYGRHPQLDPRNDAIRVLARYGLAEVRAVAKYSFEGAVRDVSLPVTQRLLYWLKRLNVRRKHRLHA